MHQKRNTIGKFWPVKRKGTKYLAVAKHNPSESMPLVVVLRDVLKIVKNKKELKKVLNEKQVKINNKIVRETNYPIGLFDILALNGASYKAVLNEKQKIAFEEASAKDSKTKVFKVLNKKMLAGKKVQLNMTQGKNIISKEKANVGDSVVLNVEDNSVVKVIPMEKGKNAFVIKGKHMGMKGKIEDIMDRGGKKIAKLSTDNERLNVWVKNLIVTE